MKWFLVATTNDEQEELLQQWLEAQNFQPPEQFLQNPQITAQQKIKRLLIGAAAAMVLLIGVSLWQMNEAEQTLQQQQQIKAQLLGQENIIRQLRDSVLSKEVELIELKRQAIIPED
ncbi:MAG: hypothetical protein ACFCUI_02700 [Bernardetiaceae bacterium]